MDPKIYTLNRCLSILLIICLNFIPRNACTNYVMADESLPVKLEAIFLKKYPKDAPGCSVLIKQNQKEVFKKAFGMANLEMNVPLTPDMKFRIGSITKQFTAICILKLVEQGKIALNDDIKKYIKDYPTHGYTITIENLLTHTSGIKNYSDIRELEWMMRLDKKPKELIDLFKYQPMDFAPGTEFLYCNSGYFLLGYIIEKVSKMSYEDYLYLNIIEPLQLANTSYDHTETVTSNRAMGYTSFMYQFKNCDFISMTLPYSAGALLSTTEDLYKWIIALEDGKVISQETLQKAWSQKELKNGKQIEYGYGWVISSYLGIKYIMHAGGINGFTSLEIYIPELKTFISILANSEGQEFEEIGDVLSLILGTRNQKQIFHFPSYTK